MRIYIYIYIEKIDINKPSSTEAVAYDFILQKEGINKHWPIS